MGTQDPRRNILQCLVVSMSPFILHPVVSCVVSNFHHFRGYSTLAGGKFFPTENFTNTSLLYMLSCFVGNIPFFAGIDQLLYA